MNMIKNNGQNFEGVHNFDVESPRTGAKLSVVTEINQFLCFAQKISWCLAQKFNGIGMSRIEISELSKLKSKF